MSNFPFALLQPVLTTPISTIPPSEFSDVGFIKLRRATAAPVAAIILNPAERGINEEDEEEEWVQE